MMDRGAMADERPVRIAWSPRGNRAQVRLLKCQVFEIFFGRKPKLNPFQREQALARLSTGETQAEVARTYGVDRATISRLASPLPFEVGAALPGN